MTVFFLGWLLLGQLGTWDAAAAEADYWPSAPLTVRGAAFRDAHGRQVILSGINLVDKEPKDGFNVAKGPQQFAQLRAWGFNCVRLGIVWAGVEPEPGRYDEAYLAQVDKAIQWAAQHGIYVILDMHQDLYSDDIGNCPYFREALVRPYPVCVAGDLKSYRFDHEKNRLEVAWQESPCDGLPTVIFLPDIGRVKMQGVLLEPQAVNVTLRKMPGAPAGYLLVYPGAGDQSRKLVVTFAGE
ncbi:MAG: cellulase family glycosylhydrolase [Planctomycetia bacterium]|nr:cellulase family glycosylhydrolase [Planctomycetia bacterium]